MLSNKSCSALLIAGAIGCVIGAASPASACWCDHRSPSRDGVCRVRARAKDLIAHPERKRNMALPSTQVCARFIARTLEVAKQGDYPGFVMLLPPHAAQDTADRRWLAARDRA